MCTMRVVVTREMLGNREICWSLWSGKDVMELTTNQIKNLLKAGTSVKGLTLNQNGELEPDKEGFYCTNIMEHRHCANYTPMVESEVMVNVFYIVLGSHDEAGKKVYDCISTKYEQAALSEEDLKVYLRLGIVSAGAKLEEEKVLLPEQEETKPVAAKEEPKPEAIKEAPVKKTESVKTESKPAKTKGTTSAKK